MGDLVDYVNQTKQVGRSPKLEPNRWIGPCVITRAHSDLLYAVKQGLRAKVKLLHHDNLKLHQGTPIPEWARLLQEQLQASSSQEDSTIEVRDDPHVTRKDEVEATTDPESRIDRDRTVGQTEVTRQGTPTTTATTNASRDDGPRRSPRVKRPPDRLGCPVNSSESLRS